ncbi:hypothetical protein ECG_02442 [Echinococcus granulosus]|uniref:Expressed conserved protein n=1 Tax=Echinococcus granulosus TaxID=6210 RepID=A0A068WXJ6_ECHGR|nr:hypothetical protein ECG_02442 [Echinococcus granulosus]CDS23225.1 expressed conserved protein [Echinococcus granulosus]
MSSVLSKRKVLETLCPVEAAKKPAPSLGKCLDEVFLGGACNPTTWRKDIAIPFLEANGIPYFNPQFDEWRPELIAQEAAAKERASCLLFVFQPHLTRGLASLVEVAYFAARSHLRNNSSFYRPSRLLLVVRPSPSTLALGGPAIFHATPAEAASIKAAYQWLEGLRFSHVRFFERLEDALLHIKALYQSCQKVAMGLHSAAHSNRQSMKRKQKKGADSDPYDKAQNMTGKKLLATYQYSPFHRKVTADLTFDLYCGGTAPKRVDANSKGKRGATNATATTNWVLCRQHTKRDFALSMAVQRHCSRLYFHISRQGLWIVEQMEAAFAIGSGKEVILCVEYLSDDGNVTSIAAESEQETSSGNSSGYSSLASTPDEAYQPPSTTTTVTDLSSLSSSSPVSYPLPPFRSVSCSRMGLMRTHSVGVECEKEHHTIRKDKAKEDRTIEKVISLPSTPSVVVFGGNEVCGLSPIAVKDHNRSRNYLKALLEEAVERGDGRGLLLSRPVEDIKDLFSTLF